MKFCRNHLLAIVINMLQQIGDPIYFKDNNEGKKLFPIEEGPGPITTQNKK